MRTDDLHTELEAMLDEIEPFTPNALAVHRQVRRRRIAVRGAAAALALVVATGVAVSLRDGGRKRVEVIGPTKSVNLTQLAAVDVVVVPDSNEVRHRLERSAAVTAFASLAPGVRQVPELVKTSRVKEPLCRLRTESGFAVQTTRDGAHLLAEELDDEAGVFSFANDRTDDFEIFASIDATATQIDGIESVLKRDGAVKSYRLLTHDDAYEEFKREFADQPDLLKGASPAVLPESFRVTLVDPEQVNATTERYGTVVGVDTVISGTGARLPTPMFMLRPEGESGIGEIFLPVNASSGDRDQLAAKIAADRRLTNVRYLSHEDAFNEFKRDFADQPDLVASASPEVLPESFRVALVNTDDATNVERDYSADPVVDTAIFSDSKRDAESLDDYCD